MNNLLLCAICGLCVSCSYSMNVIQTQGEATDILDANHSLEADADLNAEVPINFIPA